MKLSQTVRHHVFSETQCMWWVLCVLVKVYHLPACAVANGLKTKKQNIITENKHICD